MSIDIDLVGVRIRAKRRVGVSKRACRIGRAKAAVFPDPVSAKPIISLPVLNTYIHRGDMVVMVMNLAKLLGDFPAEWQLV